MAGFFKGRPPDTRTPLTRAGGRHSPHGSQGPPGIHLGKDQNHRRHPEYRHQGEGQRLRPRFFKLYQSNHHRAIRSALWARLLDGIGGRVGSSSAGCDRARPPGDFECKGFSIRRGRMARILTMELVRFPLKKQLDPCGKSGNLPNHDPPPMLYFAGALSLPAIDRSLPSLSQSRYPPVGRL